MAAGDAHAQTPDSKGYLIENWPTEKGLPQNTVTGIAQTRDGYLWISTLDGMARFDGTRFKLFKAGNTPALGSGRIRFLFAGRRGELWLATQEGGVVLFKDGRFSPLSLPPTHEARPAVIQLAEDDSGALWLSTEDGRVGRRLPDGRYSLVSKNWDPAGKTAYQVLADARNELYAVSDTGLYKVNGTNLVPILQAQRGSFVVHCAARGGGWWLSTGGQLQLWRAGQRVLTIPGPVLPPSVSRGGWEDNSGLWLATWGNGLFHYTTNGSLLQFTKADGLGSDFVRTLCEDSEGNLWVGTQGGGLARLHRPLFTVHGLARGLTWEWITSVSESPAGELWVGTDGYGLNRLRGDMIQPATDEPVIAPLHVMSALADRRGGLWLGTRQGGLYEWKDEVATRVKGFPMNSSLVRSLYEDSQGAIWVGRVNTDRLLQVHNGTVSSVELPKSAGVVDVRVMAEDAGGSLWVGTDGSGLFRWKDGQFTRFTRQDGLGSDLVWALQPQADGALWIGTFGAGLTRLKNGRAVTCTTRDGLADDVICHIADDGRGQYWFSSHHGVFRAGKNELNQFADGTLRLVQCVAYGKSDGLPTLECKGGYQPAGCRGPDGRLWFPTIGGVVVVDPAEADTTSVAPRVHLEEVFVDGQMFESEQWTTPAGGTGPAAEASSPARRPQPSLAFPAGSRRFEFHYAGLNLTAPEAVRFRHKLEGVDADWVETGGRRDASYTRLPHGTYTFRVQTHNREGSWGQPGESFTFSVLPFYWQTWWFIALFLLIFGGSVAWTVRLALRRRHQRHVALIQRLHAAEKERTRIARDIHDDLGSSLTEIGLLGALAVRESTPPVEAREQVTRMMQRAEELTRKLDETVWAVNPKNDSLRHLAIYLCNLTKEFLEPTAIRCRLDVAADLPDIPLTADVRHNVFLVAKEALNNAVRHSGATEITLRMGANSDVLTLEVLDNGRGFAPEAKREAGNGLRNMSERMQEIGGQFQVRSLATQGTTVSLRLPIPGAGGPRPTQLGDAADNRRA